MMKMDFENPASILKRGRKLGEGTTVSDLEEAIKQMKIYSSFVASTDEHMAIVFEIVDLYNKLITYVENMQFKLWYFKMAMIQLCESFYLASKSGSDETKENIYGNAEQRLANLFHVIGGGLNDAYAYLKSFQFKKIIEDKYGNKAILKFLKEEPDKKYDRLYNQIFQQEDIFVIIEQKMDKAYADVSMASDRGRPNIVSMKDLVPYIEYNDSEPTESFGFEQSLYFELTEEIKLRQKQGKPSFIRYLLENYEIKINDNYIFTISDEEIELYGKQIFEFFFKKTFSDPLEKELAKFIQRIIKEERWL